MFNLSDLQFQDDAIVSKILLKGKGGTVTLFAFAKGQALSEHTTPFDALVQIVEGEMTVTISGTPHIVSGGEILTMPANEPHALTATKPTRMVLTMIRDIG